MNEPIHIFGTGSDGDQINESTARAMIEYENARHTRRVQTGFLVFLGMALLAFLVPLGVFLTRLAGGW